ncbi:MAG: GntR family transcriptional regulator [Microbacterium sp.]|jgi:DNA-binding GntR family transcriptional regulator|uniref:GntR family transcriptional regulator n=1 Tax=Microbacterium sp. TaxID=51671 RepID=UPI002832544D|nr:GntR family transcriptional regulator [Microbacterium sp.]MDR2323775.1 GntR family transcriptional regulator [Microbacterium sp.]
MAIERKNLRSQVREELLARMRTGNVRPGEGINEVQLAAELGVSRTPLREALIALESEGQISSENGKGFRFVPLSAGEFEDLAPVMATLESLALELSPVDELKAVGARLVELAEAFTDEHVEHSLVMTKDDEWHTVMLSACPNRRLLDVIESVRGSFHRYEALLVAEDVKIDRVAAEHAAIARALAAGDVPTAIEALKVNWLHGMRRILDNSSSAYFSA